MTLAKRKQKRVPPSRVRYEAANPTVSIRISRDFKEELDELKIMSGVSIADVIQVGVDRLKPDTEQSYERGYRDGYEVAEEEYKVMVTCFRCKRPHLAVTSAKMKEAVARSVTGWGGTNCK